MKKFLNFKLSGIIISNFFFNRKESRIGFKDCLTFNLKLFRRFYRTWSVLYFYFSHLLLIHASTSLSPSLPRFSCTLFTFAFFLFKTERSGSTDRPRLDQDTSDHAPSSQQLESVQAYVISKAKHQTKKWKI